MKIALWFPVAIGLVVNDAVDNDSIKDHCLKLKEKIPSGGENWVNRSVYNTDETYSILDDEVFKSVTSWVEDKVNIYAKELKFKNYYKPKDGWFSLYGKGDSQEFHTHSGNTFSCIYCVSAPPGSSPTVFESLREPDMINPSIIEWNSINALTCNYEAEVGRLIIFRSYLKHCVPPNAGSGPRITLAYNF